MSYCKFCSDVIHSDTPVSSNELVNSLFVAFRVDSSRAPATSHSLDTRVPIFEKVDPGGLEVIILASGFEVRGFDPGRGRWMFLRA